MKYRSLFFQCITFFFLIHLALIPVLAYYGVRICPVLHDAGFSFGCKYNSLFIFGILAVNSLFNAVVWKWVVPNIHDPLVLQFFPFLSIFSYLATFLLGAAWVNGYLHSLQVSEPILEKLNVAFSYGAIILSMLQEQLADWLLRDQIAAAKKTWKNPTTGHRFSRFFHKLLEKLNETNPLVAGSLICGAIIQRSLHHLPEALEDVNVWVSMVSVEFLRGLLLFLVWIVIAQLFILTRKKLRLTKSPA